MATDKQINYATALLKQGGYDPKEYPLDKDTPIKAASWLIDRLKKKYTITPEAYEDKIREELAELRIDRDHEAPPEHWNKSAEEPRFENRGGGYDRRVFDPTLRKIRSETIRTFTSSMIDQIPKYFYEVPASTSGKYHPPFALGPGGLVRHTLAALQVADSIIENDCLMAGMPQAGADMIRSALVLHDGWKHGWVQSAHTMFTHPMLPTKVYEQNLKGTLGFNDTQESVVRQILDAIESHMGPWNTSRFEPEVLRMPRSELDLMVHLCDYIASRKYIILME